MKSLEEKVILITSSSQSIGREAAYLFAKEGARIVITYCNNEKKAESTVKQCKQLGAQEVFALRLDVTDSKTIESVIAEIDNQINTNLGGLIKTTKISLPFVKEAIINISSRSGQQGYPNLTTNPPLTKTRMSDSQGIPANCVAEVILDTAKRSQELESGSDIAVPKPEEK